MSNSRETAAPLIKALSMSAQADVRALTTIYWGLVFSGHQDLADKAIRDSYTEETPEQKRKRIF